MKKYILIIAFLLSPVLIFAQNNRVKLAISPLIRDIQIEPGSSWEGEVEVYNSNNRPLRFKLSTLNFKGRGEGYAQFIQEIDTEGEFLLTNWIKLNNDDFLISANGSKKVSFKISIPEYAPPGGMYAAIIAEAKEPGEERGGVVVSPGVSSLMLVSIGGDYIENLNIIDFSTPDLFYDQKEIPFTVKLRNMGNVHLRPEGNITIYNSEDEEVGKMAINRKRGFGNILPQNERTWDFAWTADDSIFEVGEYRAELNLIYGRTQKQSITHSINFWIIPSRKQLIAISIFVSLILLAIVRLASVYLKYYLSNRKRSES
jgi:hypothetical protein